MVRCGTGGWKPAERHRCISLRSAGPPRWRRWRSARPTAHWSSRSRRWSRRAGLPPTRALTRSSPRHRPRRRATAHESARPLIPSSQTAPPRHCVRHLTRPRLGWAGRLGVGLLRRGLGRGAEQPLRAQEAAMPAASASRSAAAWPASGSSPACRSTTACAAPLPAVPSPPRRCHAPRPQEARSTRGGSAVPSPSGEGGLSKDPSRQDPARVVKPAPPRPQRCRFRVCGQGRPRFVAASPPHAAPAAPAAAPARRAAAPARRRFLEHLF
jgi:hypothetical protein